MKNIKFSKLLIGLLILGSFSACSVEEDKIEEDSSSLISSSSSEIKNPSSIIASSGINQSTPIINVSSSETSNSIPVQNSSNYNSTGGTQQSSPNQSTPDKEDITLNANIFINNVKLLDLENISLEDRDNLNGAYYIYSTLTIKEKELSIVIEYKNKLDYAREIFIELYDEYLDNREAEETGYAFKDLAEQYSNVDSIIREDLEGINNLLIKYENLSQTAKSLDVVIESKSWLDAALNRANELINMNDDEYAVIQFIALVNKLPNVLKLTIADVDKVNAAVSVFDGLSNESKENPNIIEAKSKLDSLNARAQELVAIQSEIDNFVNLVWSLPPYEKLEWKSASDNALITQAEEAYEKMSEEAKLGLGVASAYDQLQKVRVYFDNLKEPYDISKLSFSIPWGQPINVAGQINYTCQFTYTVGKDHITVLTSEYGIPRAELSNYVKVYLNMYIEAGAVASEPLYRFDITEDYSGLNNAKYIEVLKSLQAAGNSGVFSGMGICFTLNIESLNDQYASSKYSSFMAGQKIYWEE